MHTAYKMWSNNTDNGRKQMQIQTEIFYLMHTAYKISFSNTDIWWERNEKKKKKIWDISMDAYMHTDQMNSVKHFNFKHTAYRSNEL